MKFTNINRVLSKFHTEMKLKNIEEYVLIEWIGEALDFLKVYGSQRQSVAFLTVENHEVYLPNYFNAVIQIAKNNTWTKPNEQNKDSCSPKAFLEKFSSQCSSSSTEPLPVASCEVVTDCQGNIISEHEIAYYRPYFDLKWEYEFWNNSKYYQNNFTPVTLADSTFFNSLVIRDKNPYIKGEDEYTIVEDTLLRFSFKEGEIALAYLKTAIDDTGKPLIPDNISYITAITYYLKWKIAEMDLANNRDGAVTLVSYNEERWLKYCRQAKNYAKMPKTIDEYQELMEQTFDIIPNHRKYHNFFGNLNFNVNR